MKVLISALVSVFLFCGPAFAATPVVLFDQAHGQRFLITKTDDLSLGTLADTFKAVGYEVRSTDKPITADTLSGVTALVTSGGFALYSAEELDAVKSFVEAGGAVSIMMHIAPTYENLLKTFGIAGSMGVLRENENVEAINSTDFLVKDITPHALFSGIDSFNIYGAWAVAAISPNASLVARTSKSAWIDSNRNRIRDDKIEPMTTFGLVAVSKMGKGKAVVFGDDAIFQDKFLYGNNMTLANNLALWLKTPE